MALEHGGRGRRGQALQETPPSRHVFFVTLVESVCTWARNDASKHDFGNVSTGYDI